MATVHSEHRCQPLDHMAFHFAADGGGIGVQKVLIHRRGHHGGDRAR